MSKYTTEVRFICESALGLEKQGDYSNINDAIQAGRNKIFTFDYTLFDPDYKSVIETEFLRHYYTREIGHETVALWKLRLEDTWVLNLPKYNKLWESALLEFNPLYDVDYTTKHSGSGMSDRRDNSVSEMSGTQDTIGSERNNRIGESENNEHLLDKYSDTPQGGLNGVIDTNWLTNATEDINNRVNNFSEHNDVDNTVNATMKNFATNDGSSNITNIDEYERRVVGKIGGKTYPKMIDEWRKTFLNIDKMFINEFRDLFMLIY